MTGSTLLRAPRPRAGDSSAVRTLRIGLLGHGTVGRAFTELVSERRDAIRRRDGIDLGVATILVRSASAPRAGVPAGTTLVDTPRAFAERPHDVIVEALGGSEPAGALAATALASGTPVVTANKALLAARGGELLSLADETGTALRAEAAIAAGVPILSLLASSLRGADVTRVEAILNGTSNFVLTAIDRRACTVAEAVGEARAHGFCEADAALDLSGADAAHKLSILSAALGVRPCIPDVTGITDVTPDDTRAARACGFALRPVVAADIDAGTAWIAPAAVPSGHPLAAVDGVGNGVSLRTGAVGTVFVSGPGAGGPATASALLDDVLAVARGAGSFAAAPRASSTREASSPRSEWFVVLGPAEPGPDEDALLAFVRDQGLSFRRLHEVRLPCGPVLAGLTPPLARPLVERAISTVRTVGAVRIGRAFRALSSPR